jgi:protein-disulfide isomerase
MPEDEETVPEEASEQSAPIEETEAEKREAKKEETKKEAKAERPKRHRPKRKAKAALPPPKAPRKVKTPSSGIALVVIYVVLGLLVIATSFYTGYLFGKTAGTGGTTGNATSKLQVIEYSDYQCPFCERVEPTIEQLRQEYGDKITLVYKNFPLEQLHPNALNAAIAAECARNQGENKFWAYHDLLFKNQSALDVASLKKDAADLKLDTAKFNTCLDNKETESRVRADMAEGAARGVQGTPSFWIKDELFVGAQPYAAFKAKIDDKLSGKAAAAPAPTQQQAAPAPTVPKATKPKVELFVMSYCPYGLQMEKAYVPVANLLGGKADMQIHFVSYAMHGQKEVEENLRQYCIETGQPTKYLDYLKCFVEATNTTDCQAKAGIDTAALQTCYTAADKAFNVTANFNDQSSWSGGRFPKFVVDQALNDKYDVQGSPTFIINGVESQASRSQEAVKKAICDAFTTPPVECQQTLNTNQENPGAGAIGVGTQAPAAADGGCGS